VPGLQRRLLDAFYDLCERLEARAKRQSKRQGLERRSSSSSSSDGVSDIISDDGAASSGGGEAASPRARLSARERRSLAAVLPLRHLLSSPVENHD
jgi:hypothetical protein